MGGRPHEFPRPRAWPGGVGPYRRRGRSRPAGSHAAVVVAAICPSSPGRDQKPRQSAADQTLSAAGKILSSGQGVKILLTISAEYLGCAGEGTEQRVGTTSAQAARPIDPGRSLLS